MERGSLIEALSDYLLAMRGLLEGGGPAKTAMSARVAALACEPHEREQGRVTVERALAIERKPSGGGAAAGGRRFASGRDRRAWRSCFGGFSRAWPPGSWRRPAAADEALLSDGLAATYVGSLHRELNGQWS